MNLPLLTFSRPTRGFLFIGDPHAWSKRPGTRRDPDFLGTVLGKIEQAADIANTHNLWPVFLGDLIHDEQDRSFSMLLRLTRALQRFDRKPVTLVGNHDKQGLLRLNDEEGLLLLGEAHQIELIDEPRFWGIVALEGPGGTHRVALGGTPYGAALPDDVCVYAGLPAGTDLHEALDVEAVVWLTHEDMAFGNAYPNALPLRAIGGVDVAVNGHIHATHRPQVCGCTVWYNPGNITRLSIDMADHRPSVWGWLPVAADTVRSAEGIRVPALERFALRHAPASETFNFEGRHAAADSITLDAHQPDMASDFVAQLKADRQSQRTDDGAYLADAIAEMSTRRQTPAGAQRIVQDLFQRAVGHKPV